jgi:hypothetical protein
MISGVNPQLGALEDDGEPGNAHYPLLASSPLIDAGGSVGDHCTPRGQIGDPRVDAHRGEHGILCDVGAIEFQPPGRHSSAAAMGSAPPAQAGFCDTFANPRARVLL